MNNTTRPFLLTGYVISLCIIAIVLSSKGITDESVISMNGDMAKYLMNGVYFYDLAGDLPVSDLFEHVSRYFARYPALSLGHHPLLLGVAEIPFYAMFGVSISSARLTMIFFLLLATLSLFFLVRRIYTDYIAFIASLLLVTTPFIVEFSRIVMTEVPTIALTLFAAYFFYRYCESKHAPYAYIAAVGVVLSLYSKQTAVFLIAVFFFYLLIRQGPKAFLRKEIILSALLIVLLLIPLIFITLKFSRVNVAWVTNTGMEHRFSSFNLTSSLKALWESLITQPVSILSLLAIFGAFYHKDKRSSLFFLWLVSCYLLFAALGISKNVRYFIFWIPAFCCFAASSIHVFRHRSWEIAVSVVLVMTIGYQFVISFTKETEYANGYEAAARYVVEHKKGESILYHEIVDTGYCIFFVRKHDPDRRHIVLRSDKIFATSMMQGILNDRIASRDAIYDRLKKYGVGYVVIEDIPSDSQALEWLREEVRSENFMLRQEIPLHSNDPRLEKVFLRIYEFKGYVPAKKDVILDMEIPLMGDSIRLSLGELLNQ